jgi:hypothetical protein
MTQKERDRLAAASRPVISFFLAFFSATRVFSNQLSTIRNSEFLISRAEPLLP